MAPAGHHRQLEGVDVRQQLNSELSKMLSGVDHPFQVPIELYLSVREPAFAIPPPDEQIMHETRQALINGLFEPVRAEIVEVILASLGTTVLNASFDWAYLGNAIIIPTVFIDIPPGTVTDWADLESRIRMLLAGVPSKLGIVIDVQFQIKTP